MFLLFFFIGLGHAGRNPARLSSPAKAEYDDVVYRTHSCLDQRGSAAAPAPQFCSLTPSITTVEAELELATLELSTSWRSEPLIQRLRVIL